LTAALRRKYFTTPCRENDIKYRFRRMKAAMEVDSATIVAIAEKDASPFLSDPDFIRRNWKAMVGACDSKEDALENLVLKHPGSLIAQGSVLKDKIGEAKLTASFIDATSGISKFFRNMVSDNGRRTFINAREEPAFGGGLPAWKRKWEEEEREKKRQANREAAE